MKTGNNHKIGRTEMIQVLAHIANISAGSSSICTNRIGSATAMRDLGIRTGEERPVGLSVETLRVFPGVDAAR